MKHLKRNILIIVVLISSLSLWSFKDGNFAIAKNLDIFYTLFREMNMIYVDETDPEKMIKIAADAMLKSLDPYTVYIPESRIEDYKFMTTGQYGGIGAIIRKEGEYVVVAEPYENSPSDKAGLRAGDIIMTVDGKSIKGKKVQELSDFLKGEPGSKFRIEIQRPQEEGLKEIEIEREKIQIKSVPYHGIINDSIGYFLLTNFTHSAYPEVKKAIEDLVKQGAKSLIFDLRGNGGGLLIQSVNIVNLFVNKGTEIVSTNGRVSQWDKSYKAQMLAEFPNIPLTVLVNSRSASASEIVSGSLQDLDRAIIIGTRTFGKGLVQTTRPLSYNAQLKVTTAKYYIPSGRCIQALDYSHRRNDGSVGEIPDSLISEFKTKNKRLVYDGGGIRPDIDIESETLSNIAYNLISKNLIFNYATYFRLNHQTIPSPKEYSFSDEDYNDFKKWLSDKELNYKSISAGQLDDLIKTAKAESYYKPFKASFEKLKSELENNTDKDLGTFKKQVIKLLEQEITTRYFYKKGSIENMIRKDDAIIEALNILNNPTLYNAIIKGESPKGNIKK